MGSTRPLNTANETRRARAAGRTVAAANDLLNRRAGSLPPTLALVARLRIDHPDASLAELGELAEPPITKHTVASRLRRLLALGRKAA
jgi:cell division protein WhiA